MHCIILYTYIIVLFHQINAGPSGVRRIIGGRDADEDKYPYIVRLQQEYVAFINDTILTGHIHICTGAVLKPTWTLTAAHCTYSKCSFMIKNLTLIPVIRHGTWMNSTITKVIYSIVHPSYNSEKFLLLNDIGLTKSEEIILKQYARVSALDPFTTVGQEAILTGYGFTNNSEGLIKDATTLMKPLQILDVLVVKCDKKNIFRFKPSMCIARKCSRSAVACPGDSGGPVLHPSGVIGVNSLGPISKNGAYFCFLQLTKPVYDVVYVTPTTPFIDWISDTIKKDV